MSLWLVANNLISTNSFFFNVAFYFHNEFAAGTRALCRPDMVVSFDPISISADTRDLNRAHIHINVFGLPLPKEKKQVHNFWPAPNQFSKPIFFFFFLGACEFGHVNFIVGKIWTVWNWANWKTEEKKTGIGRFERRFKVLMIQSTGKCRKKSIYAKWFNVVTSIACAMVQTSPHVPHGMLLLAFRCATICDWVKDDQGWELF